MKCKVCGGETGESGVINWMDPYVAGICVPCQYGKELDAADEADELAEKEVKS